MTNVKESNLFYVYTRNTGGSYISERLSRSGGLKYCWSKNKGNAAELTYDAARKVAKRYGGEVRSFVG